MPSFSEILKQIQKKLDEQNALAEPSIMDEYIKKNDPEQYRKIEQARMMKEMPSLAMSTIGGGEKPTFKVPGKWQQNVYNTHGYTEELPINFLEKFKGNELGKTDLEALKQSIRERGVDEPLILSFDPQTRKIKLGEGNHRLEALKQLGYTHAPVRGYRSYIPNEVYGEPIPEHIALPEMPFKPSGDPIDPWAYYPADAKPSTIIDFDKLNKTLPNMGKMVKEEIPVAENGFKKIKNTLSHKMDRPAASHTDFDQIERLKNSGFSDDEITQLLSRYNNDAF